MSSGHMSTILRSAAAGDDILIVESAMGLFDGVAGNRGRSGAAADIAIRFGIPVVLAIDIAGQAQSAGAVARGFASFAPGLEVAGAISERGRQRASLADGFRRAGNGRN